MANVVSSLFPPANRAMEMSSVLHLRGFAMLMQHQVEDVLRGKQLVFLVGAPRSGTTWLQLLLSRSPSVVTAPATHVFSLFLLSMVDQWNLLRNTGYRIGL